MFDYNEWTGLGPRPHFEAGGGISTNHPQGLRVGEEYFIKGKLRCSYQKKEEMLGKQKQQMTNVPDVSDHRNHRKSAEKQRFLDPSPFLLN